jgi:signal transduction histidine kinase/ActR/RegA family two-component response regulator
VLLLPLTDRDAKTSRGVLQKAAIEMEVCDSFDALLDELERGAAAIAIAEERLSASNITRLEDVLRAQPPWSDLPVLLLTRWGADSEIARNAVRTLGNVTLLERPVRISTLVSAVRTALRARQRQYQIRGHLDERERAAEALRGLDQRKDEFLATLGHELRNPLAPLLTGLQLLRLSGDDRQTIERVRATMERQVAHLVRLVDDLLEISRITRGIIDVRRGPVDLGTLLRAALDTTRSVIEAAGHELVVSIPTEPIAVEGDAVRLTQVFANLLTNAAKYTNPGGRIQVSARKVGEQAVVRVRDNGIGISPKHLDSVFEMFMQVDRSSRRSQGGLGIGLTLARSLVAMHDGRITAHSNGPGTGSEFVVTLPALARSDLVAQTDTAPDRLPPRRVLVVDDNRDAADTLATLLRALGVTVAIAYSGRAALDAVETFAPDIVLLDIGMPDMDGYETSRQVRAQLGNDVVLVALTGWGQDDDLRQSRAAGFDHHLVKPPDIERLRKILTDPAVEPIGAAISLRTGERGAPRSSPSRT